MKYSRLLSYALLAWLLIPLESVPLSAATLSFSSSQPVTTATDVYNWTGAAFDADNVGGSGVNADGSTNNGTNNDAVTYVSPSYAAQGQTFLTSTNANGYDLASITVRMAGYTNNVASGANTTTWDLNDPTLFRIRISEIVGTNFYPRSYQYACSGGTGNPGQSSSPNGPGTYLTFALDYSVHLKSNTVYGVDFQPANGSSEYFEWFGIRDGASGGNPYTNGTAYSRGTNYFDIVPLAGDRVFLMKLAASTAPFAFSHPGTLHTLADFQRMSNKVAQAAQPWKADFDLLAASQYAQTSWNPAAVQYINRGGTAANNYTRSQQDAAAIYQLALRWRITGNTAYADRAVVILNAWGTTLLGVTGDSNQSLAAGICGYLFGIGADLMSTYPGWAAADQEKFKNMMMRAFYPSNDDFLWRHHDNCSTHYRLNWDVDNIASLLAIGVLCDNKSVYDQGIALFKGGDINGNIQNAAWFIHPDGLAQGEEAGRDQGHNIGGWDSMARLCQIAWNAGDDLYRYDNNRVLRGLEYIAKYNLGYDVGYVPHRTCDLTYTEDVVSASGRGNFIPMYEQVYNHYVNVKGLSAPYSKQVAELLRPEPGPNTSIHPSQVDWLGFGSLTFSRDPFPGDIPPSGVTVKVSGQQALLNWFGSAYATNYVIKRATTSGGPYTNLAIIAAAADRMFYDTNLFSGATYYYSISSLTPSGETANSPEVTATILPQLIAYLKFNETSGTTASDSSSNGWNGTLVNNATFTTGKYNNAANLASASSQHVALPPNVTSHLTDFTIATWVNLASMSTWVRIFDFGFGTTLPALENTPTRYMMLSPQGGSGVVRFAVTANGGALEQQINGTAALPAGVWKHVAVTLSGSNGVLYVDGVAVGNNSNIYVNPAALGHTTQNRLGRSQFTDPYLNGRLDDFRIYNSALSPAQIAALFAADAPAIAPAAPTSPAATAVSASRINLTWNAAATATSYAVKRSTTNSGPYTEIADGVTATNFSDAGLTGSTTYYYVIAAANDGGQGANSVPASATTLTPPPAPADLTAIAVSTSQINLSWTASAGASSYNVYRALASGGPFSLAISGVVPASYSDRGLLSGATYYYLVAAVNANGEGSLSSPASAMTVPPPPSTPTGLTATATSAQVSLSWNPSAYAAGYQIKRSITNGGPYSVIATNVASGSYSDTAVMAGVTYYYVVAATNAGGVSADSAPVSVYVPLSKFWDVSTAAGLTSGSGTWDTGVTAIWSSTGAGTDNPLLTWVDDNDASFQTGGANTVTIGAGVTVKVHSINQSIGGTATVISGGTLQLDSNAGILNGVGSGNSTLTINSAIALNSSTVTVNAAQAIVLGGAIGDGANGYALNKTGSGMLTLSAVSSYSGGTTLAVGILDVRTNNAVGRGILTLAGGTLENNSGTAVTLTNAINAQAGATSTLQITSIGGESLALSGNISGSGNLVANSTGSTVDNLQLSGSNSGFSGTLTVNNSSGMRFWFTTTTAGSSNAAWVFNSTGTDNQKFTFGTGTLSLGSLSGNGNTRQDASGTTTLSIGALNLDSTFSGTFNQGNSANIIAVTKVGEGTLTLSGNNPYTGPTTVSAGTLKVTGTYSGTGAYTVKSNATLAVNSPGTLSSSSATVTVNVGGTLTSSGAVTFSGAVILGASAGGLEAALDLRDDAGSILTLAGGLTLNNSNALSFDLGSASDLIAFTGGTYMKNSGTVTVNLSNLAGFAAGTYNLITGATGIATNGFVLGDAPAAYSYTFTAASGTLSIVVTDLPPPTTPSGLSAAPGDGQALLTWSAAANAAGYNLKRSPVSGGPYAAIAANVPGLAFTDTGMANGKIYYYVVSATNAAGESANSAQASVRPVSAIPPQCSLSLISGQLQLNWPADHTGWRLQVQTNPITSGLGSNWVTVPDSTNVNQLAAPIDPVNGSVFFRLVFP